MPAEGGRLIQSEHEFTQPAVGDALAGSSEGISTGLPFGTAYRSVDSTPNCLVMSGRVVGLGRYSGRTICTQVVAVGSSADVLAV